MHTLALVGKHLQHSFSKKYFTDKFHDLNLIDYDYQNIEVESISDLMPILKANHSIHGFNVTIPYKQEIIPLLDYVDEVAAKIGAVNTVKVIRIRDKFLLHGFNTDAYGFQFSIKPFLTLHHQKALVIGTGGASKAVAYVLKNLGIEVLFVSRKKKDANCILFSELNDYAIQQFKLIVNCTPIGMFPNIEEEIPLPFPAIGAEHLCVDLIYNPTKSKFLAKSEVQGAAILNGLSMLHLQADKAFEIFMK